MTASLGALFSLIADVSGPAAARRTDSADVQNFRGPFLIFLGYENIQKPHNVSVCACNTS